MNRRQIAMGMGASVLALGGCATSGATNAGRPVGPYARMDDVPRESREGRYVVYALFIATDSRRETVVTPSLAAAFLRFSSAMWGRHYGAFIGDEATGALDVDAGRRLLNRINRNYDMTLRYEDGPFVVVLQHHPLRRKREGDDALVLQFADRSPDAIANSLIELSQLTQGPDEEGDLRVGEEARRSVDAVTMTGTIQMWFSQFVAGAKEGFTNGKVHTSQEHQDRERP